MHTNTAGEKAWSTQRLWRKCTRACSTPNNSWILSCSCSGKKSDSTFHNHSTTPVVWARACADAKSMRVVITKANIPQVARRLGCDRTGIPGGASVYCQCCEPSKNRSIVSPVLFWAILSTVYVKHLETIDHGLRVFRRLLCVFFLRRQLYLWKRLSTFVWIPLDSHTLVGSSWHHAGARKQRVVDGIQG